MFKYRKLSFLRLLSYCLIAVCGTSIGGDIVHVADQNASSNHFFDSATNSWSLGSSYGSAFTPVYVEITHDGKFAYTTAVGSKSIVVRRIAPGFPGAFVTEIPVAGAASGAAPIRLDMSPDGSRVYVMVRHLSINTLNHVAIIDTATHTTSGTIDTGVAEFDQLSTIKVTPNGQQVWVGHDRQGVIEVIDVATGTLLTGASYPILSGDGPSDIAFTPDGNFAYVTNGGFDQITAVDADSVTIIDTSIPGGIKVLAVGSKPHSITMTPDGQFAYVANSGSGPGNNPHTVSVIATGGSTCEEPLESPPCVLTTIAVGLNPEDIAITRDGAFAYVSNRNSRNVSVISTATQTVTATVPINTGGTILAGIAIAPPLDSDGDGVTDDIDNCDNVQNPGQEDNEPDGIGDLCDPDDDNDAQSDNDEIACGSDPKNAGSLSPDFDNDDFPDCVDPDDDNDGQTDDDENACGSDAMDNLSLSPDNDNDDSPDCVDLDDDNDGVNDDVPDNCPFNANPGQVDSNGDDVGDICDPGQQGGGNIEAAAGGDVQTADGDVSLVFDPGDLPADSEIGIAPIEAPLNINLQLSLPRLANMNSPARNPVEDGGTPPVLDLGTVLVAYNFTPGGLNFNSGVSLTMSVDVTRINAAQRAEVDIYARQNHTRYLPEGADCQVTEAPAETFTISCTVEINRFSIYALVAPRDRDGDGVFDRFVGIEDNCLNDFNPGQRDIYGNGIGDPCDPEYIFYDHFEGTNLE